MSDKNLLPQKESLARRGIKALLPEAGWDAITTLFQLAGGASVLTTTIAALFHFLSSASLNLKLILGVFLSSFFFIIIAFVLGRVGRRIVLARQASFKPEIATPLEVDQANKIEELTEQVRQLTSESDALEKSRQMASDLYEGAMKEIDRLRREADTKDVQIAARDGELQALKDKYDWLFTIATVQAQDINDYVEITKIRLDDCRLAVTVPYVRFAIHVTNHSVFGIIIEVEQGRGIVFGGRTLDTYPMKVIQRERTDALNKRKGVVIIEQPLRREEADYINGYDKLTDTNFYFDGLIITATGSTRFPQVDPKPLAVTVGVNIGGGPLIFGGPPPYVDLKQETQASEPPQQPLDLLDQLATFRDEGNEILKHLAKHRVMMPYEEQFEEWRARVQAYLDGNSTGYALRFRSVTVEYPYTKTASVNTRELFDKLYTRIMRLEEFIKERSR